MYTDASFGVISSGGIFAYDNARIVVKITVALFHLVCSDLTDHQIFSWLSAIHQFRNYLRGLTGQAGKFIDQVAPINGFHL